MQVAEEEAANEREQREQWGAGPGALASTAAADGRGGGAEGGWEGWSAVAPTAALLAPDFRAAMLGQLRVLVIAFDNLAETQRRKVASGATDLVSESEPTSDPSLNRNAIYRSPPQNSHS